MTLRNLPNFDELFAGELGHARSAGMAALLDQFWPECFESPSTGCVVMDAVDARRLEELFALFGVPLRVVEHSIETVGHAYDVFVQRLGRFVTYRLTLPETFHALTRDWPPEWREYLEAVAAQNRERVTALAQRLQPLSPDCGFPPDA
jgi:hypothetical protein